MAWLVAHVVTGTLTTTCSNDIPVSASFIDPPASSTTRSSESELLLVELADTDRMIALQEKKLAQLRDLRRLAVGSLIDRASAGTADALINQQLEAFLLTESTMSTPSTCDVPPSSGGAPPRSHHDAFHRWFVERHAGHVLSVVALQPFRLPHPRLVLPLSLLFVATANGTLHFYDLPGGTLVTSLQVPEAPSPDVDPKVLAATLSLHPIPHVTLVRTWGDSLIQKVNITFDWTSSSSSSVPVDLPAISLLPSSPSTLTSSYSIVDSQNKVSPVSAQSTTFHGQALHFLLVNRKPTPDLPQERMNSTTTQATPPINNVIHILDDDGVLLHTLTTLDTSVPIRAMAPHRHLLAVAQASAVYLFPLSRLGEQAHYMCEGSRSPIVALAFDSSSPSIMYATVASRDILVFDLYVERSRTCRLLHRLPPPSTALLTTPQNLAAIVAMSGYIFVASPSTLTVWNVSDVATHRPRYITGVVNPLASRPDSMDLSWRRRVHVALLSRLDVDDTDGGGTAAHAHDLMVVANVGSTHSTVVVLESFLPPTAPAGSLSSALANLDLWWARLPLLFVVAVVVVVYKVSSHPAKGSSDGPGNNTASPASMEELERMLGRARNPRSSCSSSPQYGPSTRGGRDPTFDPSLLSYSERNSSLNNTPQRSATTFDRPRPTTTRSPSFRTNHMDTAGYTSQHRHTDVTCDI
ncbi:hypothetical protein DYB26_007869 [Aphanomyces astaci]|uniref:Uncharacterized protein n=1 Tax=Aphanomyces astaci TaxID=112090 RepID=A0A418FXM8_APHAT|nr:hypothetical protein DYB26_007869 [Aphanomyces astaci]